MFDLILRGARIVDGTGSTGFTTDLAIKGDTIARIGDCSESDAAALLDCGGLTLSPGFIDMHGHSDELLLALPTADSKIRQGITTEVGGNCGSSPGPFSPAGLAQTREDLFSHYGIDVCWEDLGGFLDALENSGCAMNFCSLAGLGNTRSACGGTLPQPLDAQALGLQCEMVKTACRQGAIGVSSGLIYQPGSFAGAEELRALAAAAAAAGSALYASHIRDEGDGLISAVQEALDVGRMAETAVQLSHHKASGARNWGKVHDTLALVERARSEGVEVVLDQYPYTASNTSLAVILPRDVNVGTRDEIAARLADRAYRALASSRIQAAYAELWNSIMVSTVSSERNKIYEGQTIAAIAASVDAAPVDVALDLLIQERLNVSAIYFTMCEEDVRTVLSYGRTCIGSDSSARSIDGVTARGRPHPRAFGTFPRVFRRYVRDARCLNLEEAVRRATSLGASQLGLRRRGKLNPGWYADIVVFDVAAISDEATYARPYQYPQGVIHVIVNGVLVVREGLVTGELPGRVLRRGRDL